MCATVVRMLLGKLGCSSDHAENGAEAVEMLKTAEPGLYSLVIMDLRMPVMDGFDATRAIKEELLLDVPVVALTADETFDIRGAYGTSVVSVVSVVSVTSVVSVVNVVGALSRYSKSSK